MIGEADKWMESTALEWSARFGAVGASRQNLADSDHWLNAPAVVQALSRREKCLLLDRTLRRLVRRGLLKIEHHKERRRRLGGSTGEVERPYYCTVNRYIRVNVLMAIALAAAD